MSFSDDNYNSNSTAYLGSFCHPNTAPMDQAEGPKIQRHGAINESNSNCRTNSINCNREDALDNCRDYCRPALPSSWNHNARKAPWFPKSLATFFEKNL